jgi:hypothetical protein
MWCTTPDMFLPWLLPCLQILHAAFSLPGWRESAFWLPTAMPLAVETPAIKQPSNRSTGSTATPGTLEVRTRSWLGELLSFPPSGAAAEAEEQGPAALSPSAASVRAAAANLFSLFPVPPSPLDPEDSSDLSITGLLCGDVAADGSGDHEGGALPSLAAVPADDGFCLRWGMHAQHSIGMQAACCFPACLNPACQELSSQAWPVRAVAEQDSCLRL